MNELRLAFGFLTTIPVGSGGSMRPGDLGRAAAWFPAAGLVIGAALAAVRLLFTQVFPDPLGAALVVAVWIWLTGGLHLDGLADCGDGLLSAAPPERRLEIMRDPRLGTFGGMALAMHLLLKIAAVSAIAPASLPLSLTWPVSGGWLAFLLAPVLARWLILLAARQPMARPGGLGVAFAAGVSARSYLLSAVIPVVLLAAGGLRALAAGVLALLAAFGVIRLARARLGGLTGEVLGLMVELVELSVLLAFAVR